MIRSAALLFSGLFFAFCMNPSKRNLTPVFPDAPKTWYSSELDSLNGKAMHEQALGFEKSIVVLANKNNLLPLGNLDFQSAHISIGGNPTVFHNGLDRYVSNHQLLRPSLHEHELKEFLKQADHEVLFLSIHATNKTKIDSVDAAIFNALPHHSKVILCVFGDQSIIAQLPTKGIDAIIWAKENHEIAQERVSQLIFGSISATAPLGMEIHSLDQVFPAGKAIQTSSNGRLKFSSPEEIGVDSKKLAGIDLIANEGIEKGAFPGCQVLVAVNDQIIWRKCYGKQSYDGDKNCCIHFIGDAFAKQRTVFLRQEIERLHSGSNGRWSFRKHPHSRYDGASGRTHPLDSVLQAYHAKWTMEYGDL
jgi:hypothetical protein